MNLSGSTYAFISAFLFAAGMPATKYLVQIVDPVVLASILYLGSGTASSLLILCREIKPIEWDKKDLLRFLIAVIIGGIAAPLCLMVAMTTAKASTVSLLLNFEILFTAIIATMFFKEKLGAREIIGLLALFAGGVCLSLNSNMQTSWALLYALAASFLWSIDANITARIKSIPSLRIAQFKGFIAGSFNYGLAVYLGKHFPEPTITIASGITGFFCYGLSLVFFIESMRRLGAARATSLFATEPFIGAVLCIIFLHESVTLGLILAGLFMSVGVYLHLTTKHEHEPFGVMPE